MTNAEVSLACALRTLLALIYDGKLVRPLTYDVQVQPFIKSAAELANAIGAARQAIALYDALEYAELNTREEA